MTKYIAVIDYNAALKKGFGHIQLEAKTLLDAMSEAEQYMDDTVYLVRIAEKNSKARKISDYKKTLFTEILTNRGNGWHRNGDAHSESTTTWAMYQAKYSTWYDIESIQR